MAGKSNYLEAQFLNLILRTQTAWKPAAIEIGLFPTATPPTDAGGGTECSGGSYARVPVSQLDANWAAPSGTPRSTSNSGLITFPAPTGTWQSPVGYFGIFDAHSSGNLL